MIGSPQIAKLIASADDQSWFFLKMASKLKRGRKKSNPGQQTNKITNYLSRSTFDPQLFVTDIINELVDTCVRPAFFFASSIINEVISKLEIENESSLHSGVNVTEKSIKTWNVWLRTETFLKGSTLSKQKGKTSVPLGDSTMSKAAGRHALLSKRFGK